MGDFINNLINRIRIKIVGNFKSDETKLEAMEKDESDENKVEIAESIESDQAKLEAIEKAESDENKVEIAKSIESDEVKLQAMERLENDWRKVEIAESLKSDEIKFQVLGTFQTQYCNMQLAQSLTTDEAKLQAMEKFETEWIKTGIAKSLESDQLKFQIMDSLSNFENVELAKTLSTDEAKLQAIEKIENEWDKDGIESVNLPNETEEETIEGWKSEIVATMTSKDIKLHFIDEFQKEYNIKRVAETLVMTDDVKMKLIPKYKDFRTKLQLACSLKKDENKVESIKYCENDNQRRDFLDFVSSKDEIRLQMMKAFENKLFVRGYRFETNKWEFLFENIEEFIKEEGYEDKLDDIKDVLSRMYQTNHKIVQTVEFGILDKKYLEELGEDKVNLISCYHEVQKKILSLNDRELKLFSKCLNNFINSEKKEDWNVFTNDILNYISEYNQLITNVGQIDDLTVEDIEKISTIIQNPNWYEIKNIDEVRCYYDIVEEKCNEIMQNDDATIEQKRDAVVRKIFGHSLEYAEDILAKFGKDNENIDEGEMKEYVRCLQEIQRIEDAQTLKEIFSTCEFVKTDKIDLERKLREEYCKKYKEGLYIPKEEDLDLGETNVYNVGTDFKMIVHVVGTYSNSSPENYKEDWYRPSIASQQVCTSYIRNDMIGTTLVKNVCYGFSSLKQNSLILSGTSDIQSSWGNNLVVIAENQNETFYTPDNQINHTNEYNEMDFRRVQDGKRMEPDYIVVFKENGTTSDMEEAKKASKEWGDLPIVLVDKDACLQSERQKVDEMLTQYEQNPNSELGKQIAQKVRNNKVTNANFCEDIQDKIGQLCDKYLGKEEVMSSERKVSLGEMEENYSMIGANERKNETQKMKKTYMQIQELTNNSKKKTVDNII